MRVHHCNVNDPITTSLRHNSNTLNSAATRLCEVKMLLKRQSSRTTSTRQSNINMPLKRQGISTTLTRHSILTT